jgi:hypothetical protein
MRKFILFGCIIGELVRTLRQGLRSLLPIALMVGLAIGNTYCGGSKGNQLGDLTYSTNPAEYTVGTAITPNVPKISSGSVMSYSVTPSLPSGLSLDTSTGIISGTPIAVTETATYKITARNSGDSVTITLSITVTCAPNCTTTGKTCGDDGCGGSCGTCSGTTPICNTKTDQCVDKCTPDCTDKECGDDGCSGSCPNMCTTIPYTTCSTEGACVCTPDCGSRVCGMDPVCETLNCGTCSGTTPKCDSNGQCVTNCTPNCNGKECGDDGCGGSCGSCGGTNQQCTNGNCTCPGCLELKDLDIRKSSADIRVFNNNGTLITNATVTVNGTTCTYSSGHGNRCDNYTQDGSNVNLVVKSGTSTVYGTGTIPEAPVITSPINITFKSTDNITVTWTSSTNPDYFRVFVVNPGGGVYLGNYYSVGTARNLTISASNLPTEKSIPLFVWSFNNGSLTGDIVAGCNMNLNNPGVVYGSITITPP